MDEPAVCQVRPHCRSESHSLGDYWVVKADHIQLKAPSVAKSGRVYPSLSQSAQASGSTTFLIISTCQGSNWGGGLFSLRCLLIGLLRTDRSAHSDSTATFPREFFNKTREHCSVRGKIFGTPHRCDGFLLNDVIEHVYAMNEKPILDVISRQANAPVDKFLDVGQSSKRS